MKHISVQILNTRIRKSNWSTANQLYPVLLSQLWLWERHRITPHQHGFKGSAPRVPLAAVRGAWPLWAHHTFTNLPRALAWDNISLCKSLSQSIVILIPRDTMVSGMQINPTAFHGNQFITHLTYSFWFFDFSVVAFSYFLFLKKQMCPLTIGLI